MDLKQRAYVLRVAKGASFSDDDEYIPVVTFTIHEYRCGLRAGDKLRLKDDLVVTDADGAQQRTIPGGSIWTVLTGAVEDPGCLWLEEPSGSLHSWGDDPETFLTFERVAPTTTQGT